METLCLTRRIKDAGDWNTPREIKPGDEVTNSLYWEWLEAVFPATHDRDLMQMGEPQDGNGPNGQDRYLTLQKVSSSDYDARVGERWIYTGVRVRGERVKLET